MTWPYSHPLFVGGKRGKSKKKGKKGEKMAKKEGEKNNKVKENELFFLNSANFLENFWSSEVGV